MSQEIEQTNSSEANTNTQPQKTQPQSVEVYRPKRWVPVVFVISLLAIGAIGVWFIIWASKAFTEPTAALTFIMGSIISLFLLLSAIATTCIYWGQRNIMLQQWRAMRAQLIAVEHQTDWIQVQAETATSQLGAMTNQTAAMINQVGAMINQANLMTLSLEETRKIVEQNERTIKATEKSIEITQRQIELSKLSESAYLSVADIEIPSPLRGYNLAVNGKIFNRGKTPAFKFQRLIQIAAGKGEPPVGWGRFEWNFNPEECEDITIAADDFVNFTTTLPLNAETLAQINKNEEIIVIDGQCRYLDHAGDLLIYRFGLTVDLGPPPRSLIRYQNHERNEAKPN